TCSTPLVLRFFPDTTLSRSMDRLVQHNVLAMSGRAVEAAGDVNTLLLDKTGTITLGNRQAARFVPAPGVAENELADSAQLSSLRSEEHTTELQSPDHLVCIP